MKKVKKLGSFIFTFLIISIFTNVCIASGVTDTQPVQVSDAHTLSEKIGDLSAEKTEKIKFLIQKEFDRLYEEKSQKKVNEEMVILNQKLAKEKKRSAHYRHKLNAKKDYIISTKQ